MRSFKIKSNSCHRTQYSYASKLYIALLIILNAQVSFSEEQKYEQLGRFEISEFAVSPRLRLQEPSLGGFELSQSWIGFEWTRDPRVRGKLKLGSDDLSNPAIWYSPTTRPSFGVTEAWMEGKSEFGDLRAGLLAIPTSFEAMSSDWNTLLPETRARRHQWFIKRDFGLQLWWQTARWQTSITLHNGESGENTDGKYWTTANWRYKFPESWGFVAAASVGDTQPLSTQNSKAQTQEFIVFDPAKAAKIRQGSFALFFESSKSLLLAEGGKGEILQGEEKNSYFWGHADAILNRGGDLSLLLRFEQDQPNQKDKDSIVKAYGAGFSFASAHNLQSLTLFYNHIEEIPEVPSNEFWIIFRLHSFSADQ